MTPLAILIPISLRIHKFEFYVHVCFIPNTVPHKYQLCHAYILWRYRQHSCSRSEFWPPSWIPVVVRHVSHDFFAVLLYCAHILKNVSWYIQILITLVQNEIFDE